jgi:SsrA-binding protein
MVVCSNRKAVHEFEILEQFEAGVVLSGTEVKAIRCGQTSLQDSFARIEDGEVFIYNWHISPYNFAANYNHEPKRRRKLLLKRREINRLIGKVVARGISLIPLKVYFREKWVKVELALAKGKKLRDRREEIKRRIAAREAKFYLKGGDRVRRG